MRLLEATNVALGSRLKEASLAVDEGELVCVIGPNGSGKTSLLHALAGIGSPSGEVLIDGERTGKVHPDRRQRLFTFLPASRDIKWPLAARDLISLGLPVEVQPHTIGRLAEALELANLLDRRVDRLSTGERSRVLIARALAAEPRLLLLDEPIANLDPLWQLKLMDYLQKLVISGKQSVVLAVHDLDVARRHAHRLIVMNDGRIEADGDPQEILDGPAIQGIFGIERSGEGWRPVA